MASSKMRRKPGVPASNLHRRSGCESAIVDGITICACLADKTQHRTYFSSDSLTTITASTGGGCEILAAGNDLEAN